MKITLAYLVFVGMLTACGQETTSSLNETEISPSPRAGYLAQRVLPLFFCEFR